MNAARKRRASVVLPVSASVPCIARTFLLSFPAGVLSYPKPAVVCTTPTFKRPASTRPSGRTNYMTSIAHFLAGRDWWWSDDWTLLGLSGLVLAGWGLRGLRDRLRNKWKREKS
jgi:hypothetical protein